MDSNEQQTEGAYAITVADKENLPEYVSANVADSVYGNSNSSIIKACDNYPYKNSKEFEKKLYKFYTHDGVKIGLILEHVAKKLALYPDVFSVTGLHEYEYENKCENENGDSINSVKINKSLNCLKKRNDAIENAFIDMKAKNIFPETLSKEWRNEKYGVYSPSGEIYMLVERAASALLGVVTYGVHMTAYLPACSDDLPMRIYVPRRSYSKQTYPGKLDNTVAGGIGYPYSVIETLVKECGEEAGLFPDLVRSRAKPTGVISYIHIPSNSKLIQPEVEYIYDMQLDEDVILKPVDGEVQEFYLWDVDTVRLEIARGSFKPNSALVLIDFFIRHGIITPENEPDYLEIVSALHRRLDYPLAKF